jgi:hypothetical protein
MRNVIWMLPLLGVESNDWWDKKRHYDFRYFEDEMLGITELDSDNNENGFECNEVIATLTVDEVLVLVGHELPSDYRSPLNAIEVRKICASCKSVRELVVFDKNEAYDNDIFDIYCGSNVYGHDFVHSGLIMYPMETGPDGILSYKSEEMRGFVYSRPTKLSRTSVPLALV